MNTEGWIFCLKFAIIKAFRKTEVNLIGTIIKIFSDFHYVKINNEIFECKLREVLKKGKASVCVGDRVCVEEVNQDSGLEYKQAAITEILERKNYISRPSIANIDRVIIVAALKEPEFDYVQLNRYLTFASMHNISAVICVNKDDLGAESQAGEAREHIQNIYSKLGYEVIFTSAIEKTGIDRLEHILEEGISVLCGQSGVGKSSLLNALLPGLNLRTKEVSGKNQKGTHTTRHTELIEIPLPNGHIAKVADTPGFSNLKFDNIMPEEVGKYFLDISDLAQGCKYNNCLHLEEDGCNVISNLDKLEQFRYESYRMFVSEAIENKDKNIASGKKENKTKFSGGRKVVKVGSKAREKSRKVSKQSLNIKNLEDAQEW